MARKRGSEAILEFIERMDVPKLFFGPIGHTNFELWHAIEENDMDVTPIEARNEFVAGYIAEGWFKSTGDPAFLSAHTTPGLGNMVAPMASAFVNSSAIVNLSSATPSKWWGRSPHHEIPPFSETHRLYDPITKANWKVNDPSRVYEVLTNATRTAITGKPGPSLVAFAADLLGERADYGPVPDVEKHVHDQRPVADHGAIEDAAEALLAAERPVILAGGGARIAGASDEVQALAETLELPVATTDSGKGTIPETHDRAVGVVGVAGSRVANEVVSDADLVLAVGTRFKELTTAAWNPEEIFSFPPQTLVQLDVNPVEIGKYYPVDVALVGDAKATLDELLATCSDSGSRSMADGQADLIARLEREWQAEIESLSEEVAADPQVHVVEIVAALQELLDEDAVLTGGSGRNKSVPAQMSDVSTPDGILLDTGVGTMGASPGYAIGAQLAHPDRQVVCIEGDGGMHISVSALATAREYDLPITFVVFNDSAYTGIASLQKAYVGGSMGTEFDIGGDRYDVDFATIAAGYDVESTRVTESSALTGALEDAIRADEPVLVDVQLPRASPSPDPGVDWGLPGRGSGTWER